MSVEVATFVNDLQPVNPPGGDPRGQGDDHLRLIKQVLQNTFPGLAKAVYFDLTVAKSANFAVLASQMNTLFLVATTGGAIVATLPGGLLTGDAGWSCRFMKTTTDVNPLFIAPATGTLTSGAIAGLAQARRCIPAVEVKAIWTGTGWIITRALALPIGAMVDFNSATLPAGYEWPNGQVLTTPATNYPEYNSANGSGSTLDFRGRIGVVLDNLGGSAAGRLAGGIITGTAVGNTGGTDTVSLGLSQLPTGISSNNLLGVTIHVSGDQNVTGALGNLAGNGSFSTAFIQTIINPTATGQIGAGTMVVTSSNTGGAAHSNLQPSIMCAKVLVVE